MATTSKAAGLRGTFPRRYNGISNRQVKCFRSLDPAFTTVTHVSRSASGMDPRLRLPRGSAQGAAYAAVVSVKVRTKYAFFTRVAVISTRQ